MPLSGESNSRTWGAMDLAWPRLIRVAAAVLLVVGVLVAAASDAMARPGGGQAYSGGSRGGGGGGGGEGLGLVFQLLVWLCIRHPAVGIPLLLLAAAIYVGKTLAGSSMKGWQTGAPAKNFAAAPPGRSVRVASVPRTRLDQLRRLDPAFSVVLFEDFVYFLYAAVMRARATGFEPIAAYVSPSVAESARGRDLADVRGIIIGAMRIVGFSGASGPMTSVELEFEANYVEVDRGGREYRYYAVDRMRLERSAQAKSRPAARVRTLDCPNCGAPLQAVRGTTCSYCQQDVGYGRFDWNVTLLGNLSREPRGPLLTTDVSEQGTDLPTIVDPGARARFEQIQQRDPSLQWTSVINRVSHVWAQLQSAWSSRDPARIRPYVSDNLFQSMVYWIDLYQQQQCRNVNENGRILRMELANVLSDATYDTVTIRLLATGLDYTIGDDGRLLSGSRSRPRTYSEYWTLIRGTGRKGPSRGDSACPSCGAPLAVGMAGNCSYCGVKVTTGEFDWVLSRIEQDEAYTG